MNDTKSLLERGYEFLDELDKHITESEPAVVGDPDLEEMLNFVKVQLVENRELTGLEQAALDDASGDYAQELEAKLSRTRKRIALLENILAQSDKFRGVVDKAH
jgi:hypothetical protein